MSKGMLKKIMCVAVSAILMGGLSVHMHSTVYAVSEDTQNEIDETEREKEDLEQELEEKKDVQNSLEDAKSKQEQTLEGLKAQYRSIASDLTALQEKQKEKEAEISQAEADLEAAEAEIDRQYQDMKKRIQYMYETPQQSLLEMVLQDYSFAGMLNRLDYVVRINEYDRQMLENFQEARDEVQTQKDTLNEAKKELDTMVAQAKEKQSQISALQAKTSSQIDSYLDQIASTADDINDAESVLKAKSEALKKLYAKAEAEEAAARRAQAEAAAAESAGNIEVADSQIVQGTINLSATEEEMLTAIIYCEARGESYEGQLAVGYVVMNRVRSAKFPGSIESVIRQGNQFEPVGSGRFDYVLTALKEEIPGIISQGEWNSCASAAAACINGSSNVGESLFFRTHAPVPQLVENLQAAEVPNWIIGNHIFYYSWVSY